MVSRRPPGNVLAALPLAVLDHSRDGLDRAAGATGGPVAGGAHGLSRLLAGVAGAAERLVPLQAGQKRDTRTPRTAPEA